MKSVLWKKRKFLLSDSFPNFENKQTKKDSYSQPNVVRVKYFYSLTFLFLPIAERCVMRFCILLNLWKLILNHSLSEKAHQISSPYTPRRLRRCGVSDHFKVFYRYFLVCGVSSGNYGTSFLQYLNINFHKIGI